MKKKIKQSTKLYKLTNMPLLSKIVRMSKGFGILGAGIGAYESSTGMYQEIKEQNDKYSDETCAQKCAGFLAGVLLCAGVAGCVNMFAWPFTMPLYVLHKYEKKTQKRIC